MSPHLDHVLRRCEGCGATLALPPARVAEMCGYCDSRLVDGAIELAIDRVCPFAISSRGARERLRQHLAGAVWAPRDVRRLARSDQLRPTELRGMLVPYWVYTASTRSRWQAKIGLDWWRTETVRDDKGKTRTERVRETEWFDLSGTAVGEWSEHPECASASLTAAEVRWLGSFDLGAAVAADPRVLAGFTAELPTRARGDVDAEATAAIRSLESRRLHRDVLPGDHARLLALACDVTLRAAELVLLPVWIASFRHRGRVHRLLVHGQHGRCVGRPPISAIKVSLAAAAVAFALIAVLWLVGVWS